MKPMILVEGRADQAILEALLPADLMHACNLTPTEGRSTIVSVARTHLIKNHAPTAVVIDTDTLDPTAIAETVRTTRHLMGAAAGGTPFDVIYCVPHIEVVFFEDAAPLQRIFPHFGDAFILQFARTQPKAQLEVLLQKGGGPRTLHAFLNQLTSGDVEKLRATNPIQHLIAFISNNTTVAASRR